MVISDDGPTNKRRFKERFGSDFDELRKETFDWLKTQELVVYPFVAGALDKGIDSIVVTPANAGFFAFGLALLEGMLDPENLPENFSPPDVFYIPAPFRPQHFNGQ